ncbi:MAG: transcriptional regulator [Limnochordia bacterium]|jgi:DNA-binding HxlR family transcriptional regulator|nr:transcriptional regulator [Bacillota bacterium]NLL07616.1 helix-turn-helix domain-containing protein [Bacillota bacterium]HBG09384.1 MarR family transcriptional regulator [Bacillota bacterium]
MDLHKLSDAFQSRVRLAVVADLVTGSKTFKELKEATAASDGNLSTHLSKLEELGLIRSTKSFLGKRPSSSYALTPKGREEFRRYVEMLAAILESAEPEE